MLIPCKINMISTLAGIGNSYAIYLNKTMDGVVQYIGVTKLIDLFRLEDARCNSKWLNYFEGGIEIEVVATTDNMNEAYQEQRRLVSQYNPICNREGYYVPVNKQGVFCNETGEQFDSAMLCAKAHNLTYSALVNHLNRKPGHKTVKGRTYSRHMDYKP